MSTNKANDKPNAKDQKLFYRKEMLLSVALLAGDLVDDSGGNKQRPKYAN